MTSADSIRPSRRWLGVAVIMGVVFAVLAVLWVVVTDSRLPDPVGYPELDVGADIVQWGSNDERALHLHLVRPDSPAASPLRALLFVHGARGNPGQFTTQADAFAAAGGIGVLVEYSTFAEDADSQDQSEDLFDVVRYVRANADDLGIDPDHITVAAASAGARAATRALTDNDDPSAVPNAFVWLNPSVGLERWPEGTPSLPTLLLHGDADALVDVESVLDLCTSMGDNCSFEISADGGHGFFNEDRYRGEVTASFVAWVLALP